MSVYFESISMTLCVILTKFYSLYLCLFEKRKHFHETEQLIREKGKKNVNNFSGTALEIYSKKK